MNDDRRKNGGLTQEQVDAIKNAIIDSIYQDIGRSVVKKILWAGGVVLLTVVSWATLTGKIPVK